MPSLLRRLKASFSDRSAVRLSWHRLKALAAAARYGFPARTLTVIGITGTDGKTTTVAMTAHILHTLGVPAGAVSTSFFRVREKTEENPTHKTSLSPFALQRFLRRCVSDGCTVVVVEASSHGLVQHRLDFLWPAVAAITNTSPEHLDYHGTLEQYRKDKGLLFRHCRGKGVSVLNADDETFAMYTNIPAQRRVTYAAKETRDTARTGDVHLWLSDIDATTPSPSATVHCVERGDHTQKESSFPLELRIPGPFNLQNALCAIGCASAVGIAPKEAAPALADFPGVPGRMERIDEGQPFAVFVDFTVTPKAYEEILTTTRRLLPPSSRLLVLTGSCGNRMREKRPLIGKIVSTRADIVVVSEDETITEDPRAVIDEVWAGVDQSRCQARRIVDRREAINFLFKTARPGDAVLLCGMGACSTMQTLAGLRPWDERIVAREALKAMKN